MGSLEATFVVTDEEYEKILQMGEVYFGEALGKHSEVSGNIGANTTVLLEETTPELEAVFDILNEYIFTGVASQIYDELERGEEELE